MAEGSSSGEGRLVVVAGTDSSGKATQTRMLVDRCRSEIIPVATMSFPRYDTPMGRIVGQCYLGKPEMGKSWFSEGANAVDPLAASLLYAADRRVARPDMLELLGEGVNLVLDRYVSANMGHQGGKIRDPERRKDFYEWLERLEYDMLELPRPDETVFLYVPTKKAMEMEKGREGAADGHESNPKHLRNAEEAYLQLAEMYGWHRIDCVRDDEMRSPEDIHEEVFLATFGSS